MFKILGADQKEYGPVSAEVVRQWIAERRANAQTRVKAEGTGDWKALSEFPEFRDALSGGVRPPSLPGQTPPPLRHAAAPGKTSGLAIASLILGVLGFCGVTAPIGLILGIVALGKIRKSGGQLSGRGLAIAGIALSTFMLIFSIPVLAALLLPAFAKAKNRAETINCVSNMKQLGLAMRLYSNDQNDKFAPAASWCDAIQSYVGTPKVFQCPSDSSGQRCSYAFNAKLSGMEEGKIDSKTVMLFESNAGWNLSGGQELMLKKARHTSYTVCFADGSVEEVSAGRFSQLRWEP